MNPYVQATRPRIVEPGTRITAFYYATHRGLPVTYGYLLELGRRAARAARWYGLGRATVWEGPLVVNTWEEWIWDTAAAGLAPGPWLPSAQAAVPPPDGRLCTAWQYMTEARLACGSSEDAAFAAILDQYACAVGRRRGITPVLVTDDRGLYAMWPCWLWNQVADAVAEAAAVRGDWHLHEDEFDALAAGYRPEITLQLG